MRESLECEPEVSGHVAKECEDDIESPDEAINY